jgi:hypothetical protein
MPDLHQYLDHEARRVRADDDALAAIRRRAVRNRRGRRIVAGVVSIVIGGAGVGLAYTAFTSMTPTRVASGTTLTTLPIWPDGPAQEIDQIQQAVDEGRRPGYLSPRSLAEIFATDVMHWEPDDIRVDAPDQAEGRGFVVARIWNPTIAGEANSPVFVTVLEMRRWRGRPDGIFVVTKASSDVFSIQRPLPFEDFGPTPPVFEVEFGFVPDGVFSVGAWKFDIAGIHAFGRARERYVIELPEHLTWTSHPIATVRLIHWPEFPTKPTEGERELTGPGPDGPVLAMSAYRLGEYMPDPQAAPSGSPAGTPVPGPTPTSDDATPPPVSIVIEDRTGFNDTLPYAFAWIEARGRGTHHGGYDVGDAHNGGYESSGDSVAPTLTGEPIPITTIYCDPEYDAEARRMRELLFPGAQIARDRPEEGVHVAYDPEPLLTVALGRDFAERHMQAMKALVFVGDFGLARMADSSRAYEYVTEEVARAYREGPSLAMYEYAARRPYDVGIAHSGDVPENGEPGMEFSLTYYGDTKDDVHYEVLRVEQVDGEPKIVEASLVTVGSS